ncbi:hypothetical protein CKAN_01383200 [Cinnamomum micranthum f. kanehirae]|uniref:Uncharacterized protein n=1 Tax=Cinnamomum micranthum f. kanehirae TaxID=337451 RepID=A0A3S3P7T8_9MAGN|nr:hypothetical protein CKAN_01383200 [Cinnamomum micranthum f. kanehirae]
MWRVSVQKSGTFGRPKCKSSSFLDTPSHLARSSSPSPTPAARTQYGGQRQKEVLAPLSTVQVLRLGEDRRILLVLKRALYVMSATLNAFNSC